MTNVLQEMDHIIRRINTSHEYDKSKRLKQLKWTSTHIMRQYHIDFWTSLYKFLLEFRGKNSEKNRQKEEDEDIDRDEFHIKKGKRNTIKNAKVVKKTFIDLPVLTYELVRTELEEDPIPAGIGKLYLYREDIFDLIFQSQYEEITGQGWKDKSYLHYLQLLQKVRIMSLLLSRLGIYLLKLVIVFMLYHEINS